MKTEKLCVFCKHFNLYTGSMDTFSESAGDMYCSKKHFGKDQVFPSYGEGDLRSIIFKAEFCKDYQQVKL